MLDKSAAMPNTPANVASGTNPKTREDVMKMSCIPVCFFGAILREKTMSREDWVRLAVEVGLDGTEIYETFVSGLDASAKQAYVDFIHDAGLEVSMFSLENNFANPAEWGPPTQQIRDAVDSAVLFRTSIVRVCAGMPHSREEGEYIRNTPREEVVKNCADGLRGCLDYAGEKQVMLALEDHPVVGWDVEEFMKILELVDDERLKVNLDTSNVHPDTVVDLARRSADRVVHLHVKDRLDNNHSIVMGTDEGEVDFTGIFRCLKDVGFDGWMSLETLGGGKKELQLAIENIRNAWNDA